MTEPLLTPQKGSIEELSNLVAPKKNEPVTERVIPQAGDTPLDPGKLVKNSEGKFVPLVPPTPPTK